MLNHKTRTIWGKVALLCCKCRVCFQLSRHPEALLGRSQCGPISSQQHHQWLQDNGPQSRHPSTLLSFIALKVPGIHSSGNLRLRREFPMCQEPKLSMKVSRKSQQFSIRITFGTPLPQLKGNYFISFLLPNNLHMNFYYPKDGNMEFLSAMIKIF